MRNDLRGLEQMRPLRFEPDYLPTAEGSVLVEVGSTRVVCTATLEETVPGFMRGQGLGWVTAEYSMLPRATLTRTPREVAKGRASGRTHEIQRLIGRSLRSVVDRRGLGERTLVLDCDVLQADGGTRTASISGAFVAMGMALQRLVQSKVLAKVPLRGYLAAVSVGLVGGQAMLDLNYEEDSRAEVDMNVVMTGSDKFVEIQATAEQEPFSDAQSQELLRLARIGIGGIMQKQREILKLELA